MITDYLMGGLGIFGILIILFLIFSAILWYFVPFWIWSIKKAVTQRNEAVVESDADNQEVKLLKEILAELKKLNKQTASGEGRDTSGDARYMPK